jgi:hypothetical protein
MDKELLKIIEEKIITDDMENIFVYLTEVPSEYFPTLSILLQGTEYRNLSHRQLIDKIIPEIPKDRFFALYHDDKIENVSKEFVLEDLYDRIMTDTDAYIGTDIQISGTNLKFHFDYETDDFKDNINEVTNHVMIFEALLHLPIVDRIKLQELINIGKDILKRYQNYLSLKD